MSEMRTVVQKGGYLRQRIPGNIVALRLLDSEPETIETWYEECQTLMSRWQPDQRLRYLHDIRNAETLKLYSIDRVMKVLRRVRSSQVQNARGAILLYNDTIAAMLDTFVRRYIRNNWQIRCFNDEQEAIRWLSE